MITLTKGEIKALKALLFCEMGDSVSELFEKEGANAMDCLEKLEADANEVEHMNIGDTDPYQDHVYCTVCRECITCNLRLCRDGGPHKSVVVLNDAITLEKR